ncbi:MAG TPA: ABC transporter substrate-binding protein [Herpetosiphonaceae bacterium]|nr:ABC transporter substrate-binding protein [Herpetosiphonaceae bacterium]
MWVITRGAGTLPFVMASGDEVLLARGQGVPVKMVFLMYQKMPVAIFSKQGAGIATPADLRGKTIGLPGRYGATYIGLRGLLYANNMREEDVNLSEIGFTQFEAVKQDRVPAAVGFANNEPLRLRESGEAINVLEVSEYIELVNNGLVVGETLLEEQPELVRAFVRATRRGLADTLANPDEAFKLALSYIPELAAEQQPFERKVLEATLGYWQTAETEREGLGWPNPQAWEVTSRFLRETELLRTDTPPEQAYSLDFYR